MLKRWLTLKQRIPSPYSFDVLDITGQAGCSGPICQEAAKRIQECYFDVKFLEYVAQRYGWSNVNKKLIQPSLPTLIQVKRGDFGEALSNGLLEELHGYSVPVKKLRFKIAPNQTLPGTDVLALRVNKQGAIEEVCFVESKLRTGKDDNTAVEGYEQLKSDFDARSEAILRFVATQLYLRGDTLKDSFVDYLFRREEGSSTETFRLFLWWDVSTWREEALQILNENGVQLNNFTSHVVLLQELRLMTDQACKLVGTEVMTDE